MDTSRIRTALILAVVTMALPVTAFIASGHGALVGIESAQGPARLIGNWVGQSICQVRDSPCHDEKVVYHISQGSDPGHVTVSADKIVGGKAINMGTGQFLYDRRNGTLLKEDQGWVWRFTVKGGVMDGTLTTPDRTVYRRVALKKGE